MLTKKKGKAGFITRVVAYTFLASLVMFSGSFRQVLAVETDDTKDKEILYYNPTCGGGGGAVSAELSKNIPKEWGEIFSAAGEEFSINPNFLAVIFLAENGNWKPIDYAWATSSASAKGPMQFIPGTWNAYKHDGNKDGVMDINNPWDAVFASAKYAASMGLKKDSVIGDIDRPFADRTSMIYIAGAYNQGGGAAASMGDNDPLSAFRYHGTDEGIRYIKNAHAYLTSDFTKSSPEYGYPDPNPAGGEGSTSIVSNPVNCDASSGGTTDVVELALKVEEGTFGVVPMSGLKGDLTGIDCRDCVRFVESVYVAAGYPRPFHGCHGGCQETGKTGIEKHSRAGSGSGHGPATFDDVNYELIPNSEMQPGDILGWPGHVAIYMGDGKTADGGVNRPGGITANDGTCRINKVPFEPLSSAKVLRYKGPPVG